MIKNVPVVYSTDHNFIIPTSVAILSMLQCSTDCCCNIYILQNDDVTDEDRQYLKTIVSRFSSTIDFISMGDQFNDSFVIRGISVPTYYRLRIPWLLSQYDKIIYCDGDIIFKQSISQLYDIDLGQNLVAGVNTRGYKNGTVVEYLRFNNLSANDYINAGILVINSKQMRLENLDVEFEKHINNHYRYQDQDIINIVCKGRIEKIDTKYNFTSAELTYQAEQIVYNRQKDITINPVIIHFAGDKPWKKFCYCWLDWWSVYSQLPTFDRLLEISICHDALFPTYTSTWLVRQLLKRLLKPFIKRKIAKN